MYRYRLLCNQHQSNFIQFKDKDIEKLCVENFDYDNDGRISISDANKVIDIKNIFANNTFISFEELQYFNNLTYISQNAFLDTTISGKLICPYNCKIIKNGAFKGCNIKTLIVKENVNYLDTTCFMKAKITNLLFYPKTPPTIYGYWEFIYNKILNFYVPDESIELYKHCKFGDKIKEFKPLSEYHDNI